MSLHRSICMLAAGVVVTSGRGHRAPPAVQPNSNTQRAGVLHKGVLSVTLEAKESALRINGPDRPPMTIEAFAEPGKPPLIPGALVRAPAGTVIKMSIRNS